MVRGGYDGELSDALNRLFEYIIKVEAHHQSTIKAAESFQPRELDMRWDSFALKIGLDWEDILHKVHNALHRVAKELHIPTASIDIKPFGVGVTINFDFTK